MAAPQDDPVYYIGTLEQYEHIGAYLRALREHYELSTQDVAYNLHIRPKYVMAIEEGQLEELPGQVYTRGYLKKYADYLGLNGNDVVQQYQELQQASQQAYFMPRADHASLKPSKHMLWLSAGLLAAIYIVVEAWNMYSSAPQEAPVQVAEEVIETSPVMADLRLESRICLSVMDRRVWLQCAEAQKSVLSALFAIQTIRPIIEQ